MDNAPEQFLCPISQDLMRDPITVSHNGSDYIFDRICVDTWKTTSGGDNNPLTMESGFREASVKCCVELKDNIASFREEHGIELDKTDKIELEPFSDFHQIQDDEESARQLDYELNGNPSQPNSLLMVKWVGSDGVRHQRVISLSSDFITLLEFFNINAPATRTRIVDILMYDVMHYHEINIIDILVRSLMPYTVD